MDIISDAVAEQLQRSLERDDAEDAADRDATPLPAEEDGSLILDRSAPFALRPQPSSPLAEPSSNAVRTGAAALRFRTVVRGTIHELWSFSSTQYTLLATVRFCVRTRRSMADGELGHGEAMEAGGREFEPRPAHCSRTSF